MYYAFQEQRKGNANKAKRRKTTWSIQKALLFQPPLIHHETVCFQMQEPWSSLPCHLQGYPKETVDPDDRYFLVGAYGWNSRCNRDSAICSRPSDLKDLAPAPCGTSYAAYRSGAKIGNSICSLSCWVNESMLLEMWPSQTGRRVKKTSISRVASLLGSWA